MNSLSLLFGVSIFEICHKLKRFSYSKGSKQDVVLHDIGCELSESVCVVRGSVGLYFSFQHCLAAFHRNTFSEYIEQRCLARA